MRSGRFYLSFECVPCSHHFLPPQPRVTTPSSALGGAPATPQTLRDLAAVTGTRGRGAGVGEGGKMDWKNKRPKQNKTKHTAWVAGMNHTLGGP